MQNQIMAAPNATKTPMINQMMTAPHLPKQALLRRARFPVRAVAPLSRLCCRAAIIPPSPNDEPNSLDNRRGDYSSRTEEEMMAMYEEWRMKHGKLNNNLDEKMKRFEIFKDNLKYIDDCNAENRAYKLGLNQFADLTNEEYRSMYLGLRTDLSNRDAAESVDGRKQGDVSQIKDQGGCGE